MARTVAEGVGEGGILSEVKKIKETTTEDLLRADCIVMGCPTYYGSMPWEVKRLVDRSVRCHGRLSGGVGAAFSTSTNVGGGNETTILSVLHAMLIHGMIVQGNTDFDHYGPVAIGKPTRMDLEKCRTLGKRVASLGKKTA
jgi:NAD(P)H dehydrogenase (quinone)